MRRPQTHPAVPVLVLLLPVLLAAGLWLGGHPDELPQFLRSAFVSDRSPRVIDEALQRIESDYYRKVPAAQLGGASVQGMVGSLGDRFSHYLNPAEYREFNSPPHYTGIGVAVGGARRGLEIARVFDSSPAQRAGLKAGEVIVAVNGRKLEGLAEQAATALIKGLPGTDVALEVETPASGHAVAGARRKVSVTRATISEPVVASATRTVQGKKLGVVELATFSPGAHGEVHEAVERELHEGVRGIVLDLRANGGGLVEEAQLIASAFIEHGTIVTTRGRSQPTVVLTATGDAIAPSIPMVVLVDHGTASAAEIVTAALQDHHRATVVGTHTFGKGVFQEQQPLSNGGALEITVGEYFTPDGRNLGGGGVKQGAGITPEVPVRSGIDTLRGLSAAFATLAAKVR